MRIARVLASLWQLKLWASFERINKFQSKLAQSLGCKHVAVYHRSRSNRMLGMSPNTAPPEGAPQKKHQRFAIPGVAAAMALAVAAGAGWWMLSRPAKESAAETPATAPAADGHITLGVAQQRALGVATAAADTATQLPVPGLPAQAAAPLAASAQVSAPYAGVVTRILVVVADASQPLELQRQVQIAAGSLIVLGAVLGVAVSPWFHALSAFVGAGLVFAGASGFCGLARVLMRMPWNRNALVG